MLRLKKISKKRISKKAVKKKKTAKLIVAKKVFKQAPFMLQHYRASRLDFANITGTKPKYPKFFYERLVEFPKKTNKPSRIKIEYKWQSSKVKTFAVVALILGISLQGVFYLTGARNTSKEILGAATHAYDDLNLANQNLGSQNFDSALRLFSSAQSNLERAKSQLNEYQALTLLSPMAKSADNILSGAYLLSLAGSKLTEALQLFDEVGVSNFGVQTQDFNPKLRQNKQLLSESLDLLEQAGAYFNDADKIPEDYKPTLEEAKRQVKELRGILDGLITLEDLYLAMFDGTERTYLLAFQNYDEARATGGFIGTYGVARFNKAQIEKLNIESVYNFDGSFFYDVAAPGPLQPKIKKWGLRDANWFVDFRESSKKLLEFYERGKETADGVIAFTPRIFEDILRIIGPIHMDQYGVVLTQQNFQEVVQYQTSVDYDKELNQPKKFLSDFALILLNRLNNLDKEQWFSFFQILQNNFLEKHVLLFSSDANAQSKIENLGFGGVVLKADSDYLSVVNTNLGGTKTDLNIIQEVKLQTRILSDGSVINNLEIERQNTASESNTNYLRVLVPRDSELISSSGLEPTFHRLSKAYGYETDKDLALWDVGELKFNSVFVRKEAGKSEFAGWVTTGSKESSRVSFTYSLPFKVENQFLGKTRFYSMVFQKQSGTKAHAFKHDLNFDGLKKVWSTTNAIVSGSKANFTYFSKKDAYWAIVLSKD